MIGQSVSKQSLQCNSGNIVKGRDQPVQVKYQTEFASNFVNHLYTQHETVAQHVGVQKGDPTYARVSYSKCNESKAHPAVVH